MGLGRATFRRRRSQTIVTTLPQILVHTTALLSALDTAPAPSSLPPLHAALSAAVPHLRDLRGHRAAADANIAAISARLSEARPSSSSVSSSSSSPPPTPSLSLPRAYEALPAPAPASAPLPRELRSSPSGGRAGRQARYRQSRHHAVVAGTDFLPALRQYSCTSDVGYGAPASGEAREDGSTSSLSFSLPAPAADRQLSYTSQVSYSGSGVSVTAPGGRQASYCGSPVHASRLGCYDGAYGGAKHRGSYNGQAEVRGPPERQVSYHGQGIDGRQGEQDLSGRMAFDCARKASYIGSGGLSKPYRPW